MSQFVTLTLFDSDSTLRRVNMDRVLFYDYLQTPDASARGSELTFGDDKPNLIVRETPEQIDQLVRPVAITAGRVVPL